MLDDFRGYGMSTTSTTKKVKVVGTQEYINAATGEVEQFQVVSIEERDANFSKIWLSHILEAVDELGNAKMRVLMHLIANRNPTTNLIVQTYKEIAEACDVNVETVSRTVKKLLEHDIIRKKAGTRGVLFLNPSVVFKGSINGRMKVLLEYKEWKQSDLFDDKEVHDAETDAQRVVMHELESRASHAIHDQ